MLRRTLRLAIAVTLLIPAGVALHGCGDSGGSSPVPASSTAAPSSPAPSSGSSTGSGGSTSSGGSSISSLPASEGGVGTQALNFLSATTYTELVVEVDYIQGVPPTPAALDLLRTRLAERCNKPDGFNIIVDTAIPSPGVTGWNESLIQDLEAKHRSRYRSGQTAVIYVLYLDGAWHADSGRNVILGVAHTGSSVAIFQDSVRGVATGQTVRVIEEAILVHELGHVLGLVNYGINMVTPHEDPQHRAHDADSSCVMHHSIESSKVAQIFGNVPNQFDANCIADMQAAGGR